MLESSSDDTNFHPLRINHNGLEASEQYQMRPYGKVNETSLLDGDEIRNEYGIEVDGSCPAPFRSFQDMDLPVGILKFIQKKRFVQPTPIQMQSISCMFSGRDVIALGPTGCGKSFGYILPMCVYLLKLRQRLEVPMQKIVDSHMAIPDCLILVPTRELMNQILYVVQELLLCFPNADNSNNATIPNQSINSVPPTNVATGTLINPYYLPSWSQDQRNLIQQSHWPNNFNTYVSRWPPPQTFSSVIPPVSVPPPLRHKQAYNSFTPFYIPPLNARSPSQYQDRNENLSSGGTGRLPTMEANMHHVSHPKSVHSSNFSDNVFRAVGVSGGVPVKEDREKLACGANIIVATPGRLIDLCERRFVSLDNVSFLVVDECDKCLEMGLEEQLRKLVAMATVKLLPRQTSLWSATLPDALERLSRSATIEPVLICTGVKNTVAANVEQNVIFMHSYQKPTKLLETLRQTSFPPVIVFSNTTDTADTIYGALVEEQFHVAVLHSGKEQMYRNKVLNAFRNASIDVLVATDLASRGLDLPEVTLVVNYDIPFTIEDYIHRCGRTGRFGKKGAAVSFLTLDCKIASELKEMLESTNSFVPAQLQDVKSFGKKVLRTVMGDRIMGEM